MPSVKSKEVEKILELAHTLDKNRVSVEDFVEVVKILTTYAKETRNLTAKEVQNIRETVRVLKQQLTDDNGASLVDIKSTVEKRLNKALADFEKIVNAFSTEQQKAVNYLYDRVSRVKNGYTPLKGVDYFDGEPGKNGSPDSPEQIRDKLQGLKGDGRLDQSAIKNLEERLRALEERPTGTGGGGASQISLQYMLGKMLKNQRFNTSSATTTLTLNDKIAGDVCIWLRYQGQMMHYGTHYTISGTTVTLTFTPDDDTNVDVTYIRG